MKRLAICAALIFASCFVGAGSAKAADLPESATSLAIAKQGDASVQLVARPRGYYGGYYGGRGYYGGYYAGGRAYYGGNQPYYYARPTYYNYRPYSYSQPYYYAPYGRPYVYNYGPYTYGPAYGGYYYSY